MNVNSFKSSARSAADLLKALANDRRLLILCELSRGERTVSELHAALNIRQAALSQNLARLREDGIVKSRREAKCVYYSLGDTNVMAIINTLAGVYCTLPSKPTEK